MGIPQEIHNSSQNSFRQLNGFKDYTFPYQSNSTRFPNKFNPKIKGPKWIDKINFKVKVSAAD